ncbi:B12-binding domain-containing protein [Planktotalea sp.]|uniref:cobalamin B12-binding domain-containing protein n=1 Tax=Planktotalea sp. TaxID=2029877 RepID=UPI0025FBFAFE|nr:cobalamin B12-binding domain-containing protein [Planktotalea sp.]
MSQQQHAFQAKNISEVDRVARQALAILALKEPAGAKMLKPCNSNSEFKHLGALTDGLFKASTSQNRDEMKDVLSALKAQGIRDQTLAFEAVPEIARRLGKAWEDDSLSFGAVTIGCARLQTLVLQLCENAADHSVGIGVNRRNCLVTVPKNAHHTLGAIVLTKQLRDAGHHVRLALGTTPETQCNLVNSQKFDAIMISASRSEHPETLRALVKNSQAKGANSKVFIGGSILEGNTQLVAAMGSDYVTNDWKDALDLCVS